MHAKSQLKNLYSPLGKPTDVDGRTTLELILKKQGLKWRTGFTWLRI
jgi:hypothetical protein